MSGRAANSEIRPLDEFSPDMRARIQHLVAQPDPPPKVITFCDPDGRPLAQIPSRAWYEWHWQRDINPDRRGSVKEAARDLVIVRDGLACGLCGGSVERKDVHIDHILPRSKGGTEKLSNLQVTHAACNMRKGNRI